MTHESHGRNRQKRESRPASRDPGGGRRLTHVAYHVLVALATESRHGYGIIKYVAQRSGGRVELEAGTLYAAIKRMKEEGWIEEVEAPDGADSRRRVYAIKELGREILRAESRRLEAMLELAREADILPQTRRVKDLS